MFDCSNHLTTPVYVIYSNALSKCVYCVINILVV